MELKDFTKNEQEQIEKGYHLQRLATKKLRIKYLH